MISRRGLLKVTAAATGIVTPGVALATGFGGTVRPPHDSLNYGHPACQNLAFSFIQGGAAATTGAVYDRVKKQKGTATGTTTGGVLPWMGNVVTLASTNRYTFTTRPPVAEPTSTLWMIVRMTSLTAASDIFTLSSGAGSGFAVGITITTGTIGFGYSGVTFITSTVALVAAVPYLVIVSNGGNRLVFFAKRLDTNAMASQATTISGTQTASNGSYAIGATSAGANACTASFAAFSFAKIFTPLSSMINLSSDPWGPWRPANLPIEESTGGAVASGRPRLLNIP